MGHLSETLKHIYNVQYMGKQINLIQPSEVTL